MVLLGVLLALAGALAMEVMLVENWRLDVKADARSAPKPQQPDRSEFWRPPEHLVALDPIEEMVERPLFLPTRRPPKPAPEPEPKPGPEKKAGKLALRLTSTIITPGNAAAIFAEKGSDKTLLMRSGDKYKGWELIMILPEGVVFESDSRQRQMHIRPTGPPSSPKPSARTYRRSTPEVQRRLAMGTVAAPA